MFDFRSLPAVDCGVCGVMVKASNIQQDSNGCGVFSGSLFGVGEIMGYYYGSLAVLRPTTQKQLRKSYDDGIMFATVEYFSTWACRVQKTFLERTKKERSAWIALARFSCMRFFSR